jgi:aspartate-semialdehyde dehydrogenase
MPSHHTGEWSISLLGASTLQGKEVKAVFEERKHARRRLYLVDTEEAQGLLTDFEGEPAILQPLTAGAFEEQDLAIFASAPSFTALHWREARASGCRIIDLSHSLESEPEASFAAPLIDFLWESSSNGKGEGAASGALRVSAHPMSIALGGILKLISRRATILRAVATLFEPASVRGQSGVEELHQQTVSLLSFQEIPKKVFDAQVSFNLLANVGEHSQPPLRQGRDRIARHLTALLRGSAPQPALRLLQAPVFHGYSFSLWVELSEPVPTTELESALMQEPFSLCRAPEEQPNVVSAASSDRILLGRIEQDPAGSAGYWIWGAFDNLRVAALNAILIAEEMLGLDSGDASPAPPAFPASRPASRGDAGFQSQS